MSNISQGRLPSHTPPERGYTAMDTVGRIVLSSLSELEQHVIFVSSNPKITVICFSSWLLCGRKKKDSMVCCILFILETVHMRRNLSAATPIHSRPCTQADFLSELSVKKCSCFQVQKVHITATRLCIFFHLLALIYFLKKIRSLLHWWNRIVC